MSRPRSASARPAGPAAKGRGKAPAAKPAKGRGAAPAAAARARGVYVQAPRSDVYVTMLGISLAAMLLACLFLFLVWNKYEMKIKPAAFLPPLIQAPAGS